MWKRVWKRVWKFGEKDERQLNNELKNNPDYPFVRAVADNGVGGAFGWLLCVSLIPKFTVLVSTIVHVCFVRLDTRLFSSSVCIQIPVQVVLCLFGIKCTISSFLSCMDFA